MSTLSKTDHIILRFAGNKTPAEIHSMTGIPAEEVASRAKELLSTIDILSRPERINKIIIRLEDLAEEVYARLPDTEDRNVASMVNSMNSLYKTVINELKDLQRMADEEYLEVQSRYAMIMSQMIGESFERTMTNLAKEFKSIPYDVIEAEFQNNLVTVSERFITDEF